MNTFDILLLSIIVLSGLVGLLRGLVREIFSLISYAVALIGTLWLGPKAYPLVYSYIEHELIALVMSYVLVFIAILLLMGVINYLFAKLITGTGLTPADKGLGMIFGLVRGFIIVAIIVVFSDYLGFSKEDWWQNARMPTPIQQLVKKVSSEWSLEYQNFESISSGSE
ncbi:CvpA family protein [Basilea psittacipulmonis]|uniref:CvpA family protein n=1 Tax=Basilea psittacipulmonis TaxID=1472345 RepID=UPI0006902328|nr:CvpA family protein [Basilea psittacipulmonis]